MKLRFRKMVRPDMVLREAQDFVLQQKRLKRKKELVLKRKQIYSDRGLHDGNDFYWWESIGGACFMTSVICLFISFFTGWNTFLYGFLLPGLIGIFFLLGVVRLIARVQVPFKSPKSDELLPTRIVPTYLSYQISLLKNELIGNGSRYVSVYAQVEKVNQRARAVSEQLMARMTRNNEPPAYLRSSLEQAEEVVERTIRVLEGLQKFRAKVDGFLAECDGAVGALSGPLHDLELVHEVQELAGQTKRLEDQAQQVVFDTVKTLQTRMSAIRGDVHKRFEGVGVHLALETSSTGDAARDFETLERTIADFVPANLIPEAKVRALQNEVAGLAM